MSKGHRLITIPHKGTFPVEDCVVRDAPGGEYGSDTIRDLQWRVEHLQQVLGRILAYGKYTDAELMYLLRGDI